MLLIIQDAVAGAGLADAVGATSSVSAIMSAAATMLAVAVVRKRAPDFLGGHPRLVLWVAALAVTWVGGMLGVTVADLGAAGTLAQSAMAALLAGVGYEHGGKDVIRKIPGLG